MIGYSLTKKAYKLFDTSSKEVKFSCDVKFEESHCVQKFIEELDDAHDSECHDDLNDSDESAVSNATNKEIVNQFSNQIDVDGSEATVNRRYSTRSRAPIDRYAEAMKATISDQDGDPKSRLAALSSVDEDMWEQAMNEELDSLRKTGTWEVVKRPTDRKVIDTRWVFKTKRDEMGQVTRFKARFVVRGFTQVAGIDYGDTYSPVALTESERMMFAISAHEDLHIKQADIEVSFQHQHLQEELYAELPQGYSFSNGQNHQTHVARLKKALYGLKQSALELYKNVKKQFVSAGYRISSVDPCVFFRGRGKRYLIASIHVDDILAVTNDLGMYDELKTELRKTFPLKDLGDVKFILGCHVQRDRANKRLHLSQSAYARTILDRFKMRDCKPVCTPSSTSVNLIGDVSDEVTCHFHTKKPWEHLFTLQL